MTRQQVAQRLGKSLATVRRIEGTLLHPTRDARGQYRFDDSEVEDVARRIESGEVTVWQQLRANSPSGLTDIAGSVFGRAECGDCETLQQQVQQLSDELDELRRTHEHELRILRHERERHERESRELHDQLTEFLALMEG